MITMFNNKKKEAAAGLLDVAAGDTDAEAAGAA